MTVAIKQENVYTEVGPGSILHAFFSTISANHDNGEWGTRYPVIFGQLYEGKLSEANAIEAKKEIVEIIKELKCLPVEKLVWDIENRSATPPFEYDHQCDKSSLYTYFRTVNGRNLSEEILENIITSIDFGGDVEIVSCKDLSEAVTRSKCAKKRFKWPFFSK